MTKWTDDETATLVILAGKGLSASKIAKMMGKTRNAVIGKISRLRNAGKKTTRTRPPRPPIKKGEPSAPKPIKGAGPMPTIAAKPIEKPEKGVLMLDAKPDQCRWIVEQKGGLRTVFCGKQVVDGYSYCPHHKQKCYNQHEA